MVLGRILSERHNVTLSNPLKTKAIAESKVKTDKVDSFTLANLLRGGYIEIGRASCRERV